MLDNLTALIPFVLITSFTPGPANISSASMGVLYGYKKSLNYLGGLLCGFFFIMLISGLVSTTILAIFPPFENVLRIVGAGYILYLAYSILKASYTFEEREIKPLGFTSGLMLQFVNPKGVVYGLTLFSAFLAPIAGSPGLIVLAGIALTTVAFSAVSTWALFGAAIRTYLHRPRIKTTVNIVLALLLVYTAVDLAGIV